MNRDGDDNQGDNNPFAAGQRQQEQRQQDQEAEGEDDHEEEEEEDDGMDRDENRVLDGGVAGQSNSNADDSSTAAPRRRAADMDLMLYIVCSENMEDLVSNHPVLKEGVVVSIGLEKATKLSQVFTRYAEFCNEQSNTTTERINVEDLEFFHCQLLNGNDTAESSALMKNDRIKVRRERAAERETRAELKRLQRESDKEFFKQLRYLMPNMSGGSGEGKNDLIIDCQGSIGRNQQVLTTKVRAHSTVLARRCKWLGSLIQTAREEKAKRNLVTSDDVGDDGRDNIGAESPQSDDGCLDYPKGNIVANTSSTLPDEDQPRGREDDDMEEDDDDEIAVLPMPGPNNNRPPPRDALQRGGAAEIENDEDNDNDSDVEVVAPAPGSRRNSDALSRSSKEAAMQAEDADKLWITVYHSPEAVKILLEYCYTNRVIPLGHDAFVQGCRTKPVKPNGPVSPFSSARRWPGNGLPTVSFAAALDAISLAEEAGLPRLSLMCEVAASQLVRDQNCVEALSKCTAQKEKTGNELPRLREVAINMVLRCGPRGVYESGRFREALEGRTTSIIPTLFTGAVEAIANTDKQKTESRKRNHEAITENYFDELDREDVYRREKERRKRRLERPGAVAAEHVIKNDDDRPSVYSDHVSSSWQTETARRSLKRMSQHVPGFNVGRSYASREFNNRRDGSYRVVPRRSSRRRTSERN